MIDVAPPVWGEMRNKNACDLSSDRPDAGERACLHADEAARSDAGGDVLDDIVGRRPGVAEPAIEEDDSGTESVVVLLGLLCRQGGNSSGSIATNGSHSLRESNHQHIDLVG